MNFLDIRIEVWSFSHVSPLTETTSPQQPVNKWGPSRLSEPDPLGSSLRRPKIRTIPLTDPDSNKRIDPPLDRDKFPSPVDGAHPIAGEAPGKSSPWGRPLLQTAATPLLRTVQYHGLLTTLRPTIGDTSQGIDIPGPTTDAAPHHTPKDFLVKFGEPKRHRFYLAIHSLHP